MAYAFRTHLFIIFSAWCITAKGQIEPQLVPPILDKFDIRGVHFIPGKNLLVSHGSDDNLKIWRLSDGKMLHKVVLEEYQNPNGLAVAPNGQSVAFVTYNRVYWLNTDDFSLRQSADMPEEDGMQQYEYQSCAFSKDGQILYVGGGNYGEIVLWKVPLNGTKLERISKIALAPQVLDGPEAEPSKGVRTISLTADGKGVLASGGGRESYLFTLTDRKARHLANMNGSYHTVLSNGQIITSVFASDKSIIKINSQAYQLVSSLSVPFRVVRLVSFPKSNKCLLVGNNQYAILNADVKKIEGPFQLPTGGVRCMAVDEHEANVAYGGVSDEKARLAIRHLKSQADILTLGVSLFQAGKVFANSDANWFLVGKSFPGYLKTLHIQGGSLQVRTLPPAEVLKMAALSQKNRGIFYTLDGNLLSFDADMPGSSFAKAGDARIDNALIISEQGNRAAALTNSGILVFDLERKVQIAHLLHKPESR